MDGGLGVDSQEDLQVSSSAGLAVGTERARAGRPAVLLHVMPAQVSVNDAWAAVVIVTMVVEMRVDERRAQRPALEGQG